jgi:Fic family protein
MSDKSIHKILTISSGPFVFSRKYDERLIEPMIARARALYMTIGDLPILPAYASRMEEELIRRSIFGTAALEGNPLSEEEVGTILKGGDGEQPSSISRQEIISLKNAYTVLTHPEPHREWLVIEEGFIKELHRKITDGIAYPHNAPGGYRNFRVEVGDKAHGGVYVPPKILPDIQTLMVRFLEWMHSEELKGVNLTLRAALAHFHLGKIHPFGDGNGRTARLLEAVILSRGGVKYVPTMLSNFYYRHIDDYFIAFREAEKTREDDVTPFLEFFFTALIQSLLEIKEKVTGFIRYLTLKDWFDQLLRSRDISRRQHDLLRLLLDLDQPFTRADLFTLPSFRILYRQVSEMTARRDIARLKELNLLLEEQSGYRLNMRVLG